jgi:GNAT superfamily N-acetyltransferase
MTILPFHALTADQLNQVLAIYRDAFEAPWEWPVEKVAQLADATAPPSPWHSAALLNGDATVAIAIAKYFTETNLWYLLYLAVDAAQRGQGAGSTLLTHMLQMGEAQARAVGRTGCRGMILEVETPDVPPEATRAMRARRVAFYRRFGALNIGVPVPRPPWVPPEQPDWDIMFIPGTAWSGKLDILTRRELSRALMVEGYEIPPDVPWLLAELNRII